jgi:hypothetical protein
MIKHTLFALLALLSLATPLKASDNVHDSNGHLWFIYNGDHALGDGPWGLHLEGQVRRAEMGDEWQQWLIRPGINYTLSPTIQFSAGWAYAMTYRYGDYPAAFDFPEHRAWEQVVYNAKVLGLDWQHRLRLEQRWIGEMEGTGNDWNVENWRYENRLRYLLRTTIPLTENKRTFLILWNEVMLNFGNNVSGNHFDQNRVFIGIGHKLSQYTRLEFGFLEQTVQRRGGRIWEHNHTFGLWFMTNWPFKAL